MMVEWLFLTMPWLCLQFVIAVFPDHTHYFFVFYTMFIYLVARNADGVACKRKAPLNRQHLQPQVLSVYLYNTCTSRDMIFPTMRFVRPTKA